ncbi:MAG: hypothetical protein QM635_02010 [Microbacteriaceae bacterium]
MDSAERGGRGRPAPDRPAADRPGRGGPDGAAAAILRITSSGGRVLLVCFLGAELVLATANLGAVQAPWPVFAAFWLVSLGAVLVTLVPDDRLPTPNALAVVAATSAATAVATWNMPVEPVAGYASWHLGAVTFVLLFLGMWGRIALAWCGFAIVTGITLLWTLTAGGGETYLLALVPNQGGTLLVGTLFAIGLRHTSRRIAELHLEQAMITATESATRAAAEERMQQAARLDAIARPALERIIDERPYTAAERETWMRLEAAIRDQLRATVLVSSELSAAAEEARRRGVEVTLLDDSAGSIASASDRERVVGAIVAELRAVRSGRLVGRLLPPGRGQLATIVVDEDGAESRHIDV